MNELQDFIDNLLFFFPPFVVMPYCVYKLLMAPYPGSKSFPLILIASSICFFFAKLMEMVITTLDPLIITPLPTVSLQVYAMTVLAALPGWAFLYLLKKLHLVHFMGQHPVKDVPHLVRQLHMQSASLYTRISHLRKRAKTPSSLFDGALPSRRYCSKPLASLS